MHINQHLNNFKYSNKKFLGEVSLFATLLKPGYIHILTSTIEALIEIFGPKLTFTKMLPIKTLAVHHVQWLMP